MEHKPDRKVTREKSTLKEWVISIGVAILTAIFIQTFIFNVTLVDGVSMYPTLEDHDRLILKKYEALLKTEDYERGDIVVFASPLEDDDRSFIKRVIGVPGDEISIQRGKIYVNDEMIDEPYIEENSFTKPLYFGEYYIVLENELFVVGDNRLPGKSNDSRSFGSISLDDVKGKIVFRFFPLRKFEKNL